MHGTHGTAGLRFPMHIRFPVPSDALLHLYRRFGCDAPPGRPVSFSSVASGVAPATSPSLLRLLLWRVAVSPTIPFSFGSVALWFDPATSRLLRVLAWLGAVLPGMPPGFGSATSGGAPAPMPLLVVLPWPRNGLLGCCCGDSVGHRHWFHACLQVPHVAVDRLRVHLQPLHHLGGALSGGGGT